MARPREFDEAAVLDATMRCFWMRGYEATTIRHLIDETGLTSASLYNAFGDKRALYRKALDHYADKSIADRIRRCERLPAHEGLHAFFAEIVSRSLADFDRKGCMMVNAALEVAPHDPEFQQIVAGALVAIETFFVERIQTGQADGVITDAITAETLGQHLLGALMGIRTLARVRPERALLESIMTSALALLDPGSSHTERPRRRRAKRLSLTAP